MAKAVTQKGELCFNEYDFFDKALTESLLKKLYQFIDNFRKNPDKLSSFVLVFKDPNYNDFDFFEKVFWEILESIDELDKLHHPHDNRVSSDPCEPNYSFSIKEEAFFILMLHPQSPRFARRYKYPTLVFNPHIQFEKLREKGKFKIIRDHIRSKDIDLQGFMNPMLSDHGEISEVFQYTGIDYSKEQR